MEGLVYHGHVGKTKRQDEELKQAVAGREGGLVDVLVRGKIQFGETLGISTGCAAA